MTTILLVDNDPLQALARKSMLEKRFSDVQRVADPAEALCLVEQPMFANHLGLVVTGTSMPGIGGPAFVAELHERLPRVPVLVLGSEGACQYEGTFMRFLARPFVADQLLTAADELLAQHAA